MTLKKKPGPKKGTVRPRLKISKVDALFSKLIRERADWRCEHCKKWSPPDKRMGLHCSHLWGRARAATRFCRVNCFSLCHGCHSFFTANPILHHRWALAQLGPREFADLEVRANSAVKRSKADLEDLYQEMKAVLKWMQAERARGVTGRIDFTLEG